MTLAERFAPGTHDELPHIVDNETGRWAKFISPDRRNEAMADLANGNIAVEKFIWRTPEEYQ